MSDVIVIPNFKIGKSSVFHIAYLCERCISNLCSSEEGTVYHQYLSLLTLIISEGGELENYNKYKEIMENGTEA